LMISDDQPTWFLSI